MFKGWAWCSMCFGGLWAMEVLQVWKTAGDVNQGCPKGDWSGTTQDLERSWVRVCRKLKGSLSFPMEVTGMARRAEIWSCWGEELTKWQRRPDLGHGALGNRMEEKWVWGRMLCTELQVWSWTKFLTSSFKTVVQELGLGKLTNLPKVTYPINDRV